MEAAKELSHDILQAKTALADPWLGLDFDGSVRGRVGEGNMLGARAGNRVGNTEVRADSRSGGKGIAEVYDHERSRKRTCTWPRPSHYPPRCSPSSGPPAPFRVRICARSPTRVSKMHTFA